MLSNGGEGWAYTEHGMTKLAILRRRKNAHDGDKIRRETTEDDVRRQYIQTGKHIIIDQNAAITFHRPRQAESRFYC